MYTCDMRVGFSQSDLRHRMTIPAVIDAFQDVACFHADAMGAGFYKLSVNGLVWIINYWELDIERLPDYYEKVTVATIPYSFRGFMGQRNCMLIDEAGNYIVKANSLWVLMDWDKQVPAKIPPEAMDVYEVEDKIDMNYGKRKIAIPAEDACTVSRPDPITIEQHHLDFNGHVNNGQYIKIAMALLPDRGDYKRLRVEYRSQGHKGDIFYPVIFKTEGAYTVALNNAQGEAYAVLELLY